jgi:hypothetical protein
MNDTYADRNKGILAYYIGSDIRFGATNVIENVN